MTETKHNHKHDFVPPPFRYRQGTTNNNVDVSNSTTNQVVVNDSITNITNVNNVVNVNVNHPSQPNYIYGTKRNDVLNGTPYTDYIYGKKGNDTITGNGGTDYLYGQQGSNSYYAKDAEQDFIYITRDAKSKKNYKNVDFIRSADAIDRIDVLGVSASKVKVREFSYITPAQETISGVGIFAKGRLEAIYTGGDLSVSQVEGMII